MIPAYQAETTLAATIASVRGQTRPVLEIVVIDDGSSDRTAAIARDAGARVISTANGGAARARNVGIEAAEGSWIALLDADDRWLPEKIETQWAALEVASDVHFVVSDFAYIDVDGTRHEGGVANNPGFRRVHPVPVGPNVVRVPGVDAARGILYGNYVLPSTALFRRSIALERDALFSPRAPDDTGSYHTAPEDSEWYLRYCRSSDILIVMRPLVDYRSTPAGLSGHPGRVRYGDVLLMDRIVANAERYPPGIAALARARRPSAARSAVVIFGRRLELEAAAHVAADAWRTTPGVGEALVLAVARALSAPPLRFALAAVRGAWRRRPKRARSG